jgi:murein DD-endopeptidase MepM/ murein hydrolase activator NlpD
MDGPIGTGTFIWPTTQQWVSGYDWSPSTNHWGIDIGGKIGNPIYATDQGVVVYSGWNNFGYGNLIVLDHGNGFQTVYAHLDTLAMGCGDYAFQWDIIGTMGSTGNSSGPHLHFEIRTANYGKVNPHDLLIQ